MSDRVYNPPARQLPRLARPQELGWIDVASLVISKMVGTGIFTGPFAVLQATNNRNVAIGFWLIGFIYTVASLFVYLQYARDLPYSGGELIYLDELFTSTKPWLRRFDLLAYTVYATYFTLIYTTANNSMEFAWQIWQATSPSDAEEPDQKVLRLIAVAITTLISLLLYASSAKSRRFNRWAASGKLLLLATVIIAGGVYQYQHRHDPSTSTFSGPSTPPYSWVVAPLQVLFPFNGWENATLVAGEIPKYRVLRKGFIAGVLIVGLAYMVIIAIVCSIHTWPSTIPTNYNYMAEFFGGSGHAGAHVVASILTALSAVGSMIAVTYTCVVVNRAIGWSNVLPFSPWWRSSRGPSIAWTVRNWRRTDTGEFSIPQGTAEGGILLHWLATVFWISVSAVYRDFRSAAQFTGAILVYAHCFATLATGLGFVIFRHDPDKRPTSAKWDAGKPFGLQWLLHSILGLFTAGLSLVVIACAPILAEYRVYLWISLGVICAGALYWVFCVHEPIANRTVFRMLGLRLKVAVHTDQDSNPQRICDRCKECAQGAAHRHAPDGYRNYTQVWARSELGERGKIAMRWLGGPDTVPYEEHNAGELRTVTFTE